MIQLIGYIKRLTRHRAIFTRYLPPRTHVKIFTTLSEIMKSFIICVLALVAIAAARPEEYTNRFDNVNIDEILGNRRLLTPYIKCVLDQGKCTADGKELKSHIKEALETYCEKCNDIQREKTRTVIRHLINNEVDYWNQLTAKYDPSKKYTSKYEAELKTLKA